MELPPPLLPLRSVALKGFRKRAPALPVLAQAKVPGAQWARGWQRGGRAHVVVVQANPWPVPA